MGFNELVWELTKQVPEGKVTTYREIAHALNCRAYRAVGNALNRNPHIGVIPCHRVVNSDGRIGGFAHDEAEKIKRLNDEGIQISKGRIVDFETRLHRF